MEIIEQTGNKQNKLQINVRDIVENEGIEGKNCHLFWVLFEPIILENTLINGKSKGIMSKYGCKSMCKKNKNACECVG